MARLPLFVGKCYALARNLRERANRQHLTNRGRGCNLTLLGKGLVVRFDLVQRVKIIDHQPVGLLHAFLGAIAEKIQTLELRAVAEMEARDRIERMAA
jgi:hypothetical protein